MQPAKMIVMDVREAVDKYYASFVDPQHAREENIIETEIHEIVLELGDMNYGPGNLHERFNEFFSEADAPLHPFQVREAAAARDLGLTLWTLFNEFGLYSEKGQLVAEFDRILNDGLLCLYNANEPNVEE